MLFGSTLSVSLAVGEAPASATGLQVANCSGSPTDTDSLPYAVAHASAGETISFLSGLSCPPSSPILLTSTIDIGEILTIIGPGASTIAVSGGGTTSVFNIETGTVSISGLTIEDGHSGNLYGGLGGGMSNSGTLTVTDTSISGNTDTLWGGGGIANFGPLTVTDSAFTKISGGGYGGGAILNGGGCASPCATLTVTGSTFSGNFSGSGGGGITNDGSASIRNSTFWHNTAVSIWRCSH